MWNGWLPRPKRFSASHPVSNFAAAALLIIDVQKAIDAPYHALHGPRNNPDAESRIAQLLDAWRKEHRPIIHIRHDSTTPSSAYRPGQQGNNFKTEVAPAPGTAKLLAAGDDRPTGIVVFTAMDATQPWGRLRGLNQNSLIELDYADIDSGGSVGGAQLNAVIAMTGTSTLPDPVLKVSSVLISNSAGPGIYLSDAAFTSDSDVLQIDNTPAEIIAAPAMALGSIPSGTYPFFGDILVVENANIFDNLTINTTVPIHFKTDSVHVGGLAPTFVPNVTLTLNAGVTLKFERASTAPTLVGFGDIGQSPDKNAALIINGTTDAPVLLTSAVRPTPAPGDWAGLWLITSVGSQLNNVIIEYAGGDAGVGPLSCGPVDPTTHSPYRHTAALLVGDGNDLQYAPPAGLVTNGTFRNNAGNFAIDSVWQSTVFGPSLNATNTFTNSAKVCTQSKNYITGGCVVAGVDQSGCLVP